MSITVDSLRKVHFVKGILGEGNPSIGDIRIDSRAVERGDIFAFWRGQNHDGARFIEEALQRGAVALLSDRPLTSPVPVVLVDDVRKALGPIAELIHGHPTRKLKVVGVTGTNGKTTTTWLIDDALRRLGWAPALMGTIEARG
ncbi:MAG: Mur ligase domain-containing protein, partial [Sandaracinaceae bacterium]|nr:Mur ligase domain-containing protein [Sandaracinaceae bacterium]